MSRVGAPHTRQFQNIVRSSSHIETNFEQTLKQLISCKS